MYDDARADIWSKCREADAPSVPWSRPNKKR
jgi:hypothetical protein